MGNLDKEYALSCYSSLYVIKENEKNKIEAVRHIITDKIYIKKTVKNYNLNVYEKFKNIDCINFPKIFELIEFNNQLIIIEEFINGNTLQEMLDKNIVLDKDTILNYIMTICDALSKLHSLNEPIIHRDIKPSNIMISNDGILKIIDFDASRIYNKDKIQDTYLLGTEGFASPEAYGFAQTDCRSDVYSIGVLINVLINGCLPKEKIVSGDIGKVIKKCTNISPDLRYSSLKDVKKDIYRIKNKKPISNRFSLPGFRGDSFICKITATFWYIIIAGIPYSYYEEGTLETNFKEAIFMPLTIFLLTLLYGNYLNILDKLPLTKQTTKTKRIVAIIFYTFLIFLIYGILTDSFYIS